MDNIRHWKNILLQWISECGFMEQNFFNLEQTDIDMFYINFSEKHHKIASSNHLKLLDFLKQFYPEFEAHCDDDNILSSGDYIYVYTLLLHFSCVTYPQTFFHDICQKLPISSQQTMGLLFLKLLEMEKLNKDNLRHVIGKAVIKAPSISRWNSDPMMFTNNETDSPVKNIGAQRNSPLTPRSNLLEERTRELFDLRAQLETERYEKDLLEIQIKENENKILKLNEDHKCLIQQMEELKIDVVKKSSENNLSVNCERNGDEQRFIKEISRKDDEILKLSETVRAAQDDKILAKEKETRLAGLNACTESVSSFQCLTEVPSELTLISNEPENLAVSVIDKQLREKELENIRMREELQTLNGNNKLLSERIQELIKFEMSEFKMIHDESDPEMDISTNCDPYAHFNVFAKCMEKINQHHQVEKGVVKKLAHEIEELQKKNLELTRQSDSMLDNITLLKNKVDAVQRNNEDLEETKQQLQNSLRNYELEVKGLQEQLESGKCVNENSNEVTNAANVAKLHQMEKINAELTSSNVKLEEQTMALKSKLQALEEECMMQTNRLEEQIKLFNDESEELQLYQDENLTLKSNYDQILMRKESLKNNCRETMRNEIIWDFDMEISTLTMKNANLELHILTLMKEHQEEKQQLQKDEVEGRERIKELDNEIFKMNEELARIHIISENSDLEVTQLKQTLEQMEREIIALIKLCSGMNSMTNDSGNILKELQYHIKLLIERNTVAADRIETLEISEQESNTRFNDLLKQAQEQERILNQRCINTTDDLLVLTKQKCEYEEKIEKLNYMNNEHEKCLKHLNSELKLEKERNNNKEKELLSLKAEHDDVKGRLNEAEKEVRTLHEVNCAIKINYERLHAFEVRVMECSDDNDRFKREIHTLKQELSKTAKCVIDGDQLICKLKEEVKNCDSLKKEVSDLQDSLSQCVEVKEMLEHELEEKAKQIVELRESSNEQSETLIKLTKEKERLLKESSAFASQIQQEQEEKSLLLSSLEKSTTRMRGEIQKEESRSENLKRHNNELKLQLESLQQQNEKLQNELSEHKADFKALVEEKEQMREDFQEKRTTLMNRLAESCDEVAKYHLSFAELVVTIENSINQSVQMNEFRNMFKPCDSSGASSANQLRQWINCLFYIQNLQQNRIGKLLQNEKQYLRAKEELIKKNQELQFKIDDAHKAMENTYSIMQKQVTNKVKCLEEEILNLEAMNERITHEKAAQQSHINQQEEACQSANMKLEEATACNQQLTLQLGNLKKEMEILQVNHVPQEQYNNLEMEHKQLLKKFKQHQTLLVTVEAELSDKSKALSDIETTLIDMKSLHKDLEKKIAFTTKKLDETVNDKVNTELKCEQLRLECQRCEKDIELLNLQQENIINENNRVCSDFAAEKDILRNEIKECEASLLRANESASQDLQKIASISMEKERVCEENQSLRKQLEEMSKRQTNTETKIKSFIEDSQSWERQFHASETELKNVKIYLEKSEADIERLKNENKKLRESQQLTIRRVEKTALKLGDAQARGFKLERDNQTLSKTLEANSATIEGLQKENDLVEIEVAALKERLLQSEKGHEQLLAKIANLERVNQTLQAATQKLEAREIDDKAKINKLEKVRETKEDKIRQLTAALNSSEHSNVKLNLEIGALNSQLQELKLDLSANYNAQIEQMELRLALAQEQAQKYTEDKKNLINQIKELQDENARINDQLSKVSLAMRISEERYDTLYGEMEQMRGNLPALRQAKASAERELEIIKQSLKEMHDQNQELICERDSLAESLEKHSALLDEKMKAKTNQIENLECELNQLREKVEMQNLELREGRKLAAKNVTELHELRTLLSKTDETLKREQQSSERLRSDNQLLENQYQEVKKHAAEVEANNEKRIKVNTLELEVSGYSSSSSSYSSSISIYSCCLNICSKELLFSITLLRASLTVTARELLFLLFLYYFPFFGILSMLEYSLSLPERGRQ
uniref:Uncharacterized protein n=1 Tax=Glossina pallidipes TaxID=7398 RepID=A0A1A9Z3S6_GLOPL